MAACRLPSARRMAACRSPCAALIAAWASPSATLMADCWLPSDCRILARFSWSACFCRARAWRIWGGGAISTISMRLMRMPHLSVTTSICSCTSVLMRSRSDRASSSVMVPMTDRKRGAGQGVDGDVEVLHAEQRLLGVDHLGEDRGVHGDHHVVLGDHVLAIAGHGDLPHVDRLHLVDEREDHDQAGLVGQAVLAQALHHADLALLDDVDGAAQGAEQDEDQQAEHDQSTDRDVADDGDDHG